MAAVHTVGCRSLQIVVVGDSSVPIELSNVCSLFPCKSWPWIETWWTLTHFSNAVGYPFACSGQNAMQVFWKSDQMGGVKLSNIKLHLRIWTMSWPKSAHSQRMSADMFVVSRRQQMSADFYASAANKYMHRTSNGTCTLSASNSAPIDRPSYTSLRYFIFTFYCLSTTVMVQNDSTV